jgi:hypothetical protein
MQQIPKIGEDVTALMAPKAAPPVSSIGGVVPTVTWKSRVPPVGADVSELMSTPQGEVSPDGRLVFRSSNENAGRDTLGLVTDSVRTGLVKGAANSAVGLGRLAHKIPGVSGLIDAIYNLAGVEGMDSGRLMGEGGSGVKAEDELGLRAKNPGEQTGMALEQGAEFFAAGGPVRRAVTAGLSRLPTTAATVSEALTGVGVSAMQGGDPTTAALIGAAGPLAGKVIPAAVNAARPAADRLRGQARTQIEQALDPTTRKMKAKTLRVTPQIQKREMTGSREAILADAQKKAEVLGQRIDDELTQAGVRPVDLAGVRRRISAMKGATYEMVPQASGPSKQVIHDPRKFAQIEKIENLIDAYGDSMNVRQAVAIRRTWDDVVERAGGYDDMAKGAPFGLSLDDASEASVIRDGVEGLRKALSRAVPEVRDLNREFGFWADLRDVLKATQLRQTGQKRGLFRKIMRGSGTAAGAVVGSSGGPTTAATGAVLAGTLADRAEQMFQSPQWKLLSAKYKTRLADAIASGSSQRISQELGKIGTALNALRSAGSVQTPAMAR